jgi:hypothetical protein
MRHGIWSSYLVEGSLLVASEERVGVQNQNIHLWSKKITKDVVPEF